MNYGPPSELTSLASALLRSPSDILPTVSTEEKKRLERIAAERKAQREKEEQIELALKTARQSGMMYSYIMKSLVYIYVYIAENLLSFLLTNASV
jgi:hypothetical protein